MEQTMTDGKTSQLTPDRINELFASKGYRGEIKLSFTTDNLYGRFIKEFKTDCIRVLIDLERNTYEITTSTLSLEIDDAKEFTGLWTEAISLAEESKRILELEGGQD